MKREFIVQQLCEKRKEKTNTCQGTCHLGKQLAKAEDDSSREPQSSRILKIELPDFFLDNNVVNLMSRITALVYFRDPLLHYASPDLRGLLRPPGYSVFPEQLFLYA